MKKTYKFTASHKKLGVSTTEYIEAPNPPIARQMAEARFPGFNLYGFNQV